MNEVHSIELQDSKDDSQSDASESSESDDADLFVNTNRPNVIYDSSSGTSSDNDIGNEKSE